MRPGIKTGFQSASKCCVQQEQSYCIWAASTSNQAHNIFLICKFTANFTPCGALYANGAKPKSDFAPPESMLKQPLKGCTADAIDSPNVELPIIPYSRTNGACSRGYASWVRLSQRVRGTRSCQRTFLCPCGLPCQLFDLASLMADDDALLAVTFYVDHSHDVD